MGRPDAIGAIVLVALALLLPALAWANPAADQYNQGNRLFEQKDYAKALEAYEAAQQLGGDDPDLYLNLGNAAFRLNQTGLAIWAYQMGLRLAPRDGDLRFNLRYAEAFRRDELPKSDADFLPRLFEAAASRVTATEAAVVAGVAWLILGLAAMLWIRPRHRLALAIAAGAALLVLAVFGPLAAWRMHEDYGVRRAILTADAAVVRTSPAADAPEAFTAHAGLPLQLLDERDAWCRIRIPTGLEGWVEKPAYKALRP